MQESQVDKHRRCVHWLLFCAGVIVVAIAVFLIVYLTCEPVEKLPIERENVLVAEPCECPDPDCPVANKWKGFEEVTDGDAAPLFPPCRDDDQECWRREIQKLLPVVRERLEKAGWEGLRGSDKQ